MSEEKDTAASPEGATPEVKPTDKPADKPVEKKKPNYVLVQHLQRYAETRGVRAARGGSRRQGVLLDDGTRIRQKAYRYTQMGLSSLADNHQSILEHIRDGRIAIFTPNEVEMTYDQVVALLKGEAGVKKVEEAPIKKDMIEMVAGVRDEELQAPAPTKAPTQEGTAAPEGTVPPSASIPAEPPPPVATTEAPKKDEQPAVKGKGIKAIKKAKGE